MKLSSALVISKAVSNAASAYGGCGEGQSGMTCATTCSSTEIGRKWKARQKFYFESEDTISQRISPSPNGMNDEELKDFRFTMRFDRNQCGKEILDAIESGAITLEMSDFNNLYKLESIYKDYSTCPTWQNAVYVQARHQNPDGLRDWVYRAKADKHKDQFYLVMGGLRNVEELGVTRDDAKKCLESVWMNRLDEVGEEDADYTKCLMYNRCGVEPDWGATTAAPTTAASTTVETTTVPIPEEVTLPDYNDDNYSFNGCDADGQCKLTMSDGQEFTGFKEEGSNIITFHAIPFAAAPVGNKRWKAPELITKYSDPIDATTAGYACATMQTVDNPATQNQSEDCLHLNIQVAEWVLKNKQKKPMVAYIHGGSFNWGDNWDDLSTLVSQGMVTVNINYRLGPYGFLHLQDREDGQAYRGNWGFLDQLAGLKWISMYAGVFGGDKNIVTLDGCSAGSMSAWMHLTNPSSWPYFHRVVSTGIGFASSFYWEGSRTDNIRNEVFSQAGVSNIDELRQLSTGTLRKSWIAAKGNLEIPSLSTPSLDFFYTPTIDGDLVKDHLVYAVRNGQIRPNTPISWTYSKDDGWNFIGETMNFMMYSVLTDQDVESEIASTGFTSPPSFQDEMYRRLFPEYADQLIAQFGCKSTSADCVEELARFQQASHWYCNTRWAMKGALQTNNTNLGAIYPTQWEFPNCDSGKKSCHCGEGNWIRGGRTWGTWKSLGQKMKTTFGNFYKNGVFDSTLIQSWEEMNFNAFNRISGEVWTQSAILDWTECDLLDQVHERYGLYTWGLDSTNRDGLIGVPPQ